MGEGVSENLKSLTLQLWIWKEWYGVGDLKIHDNGGFCEYESHGYLKTMRKIQKKK